MTFGYFIQDCTLHRNWTGKENLWGQLIFKLLEQIHCISVHPWKMDSSCGVSSIFSTFYVFWGGFFHYLKGGLKCRGCSVLHRLKTIWLDSILYVYVESNALTFPAHPWCQRPPGCFQCSSSTHSRPLGDPWLKTLQQGFLFTSEEKEKTLESI